MCLSDFEGSAWCCVLTGVDCAFRSSSCASRKEVDATDDLTEPVKCDLMFIGALCELPTFCMLNVFYSRYSSIDTMEQQSLGFGDPDKRHNSQTR